MKDFKIEYANGELVALDLNGMSLLDNVQGISFKHELGDLPIVNITQGYKIHAPQDEPKPIGADGWLSDDPSQQHEQHEQQERQYNQRARQSKRRNPKKRR